MTHITCSYPSTCMNTIMTFHVLLPKRINFSHEDDINNKDLKFKTLYLLHGAQDNADSWLLNTNISILVDTYNFAVVLPSANNSFYLNHEDQKFFTYISEELINYTREIFPLSTNKEDTFIGGASMGGYGALRTSLLCPNTFSKVFSLSGPLKIKTALRYAKNLGIQLNSSLCDLAHIENTDKDLFYCLENSILNKDPIPSIYLACGNNDLFIKSNENFTSLALKNNLKVSYNPSLGEHDWKFWSDNIESAIKWLLNSF